LGEDLEKETTIRQGGKGLQGPLNKNSKLPQKTAVQAGEEKDRSRGGGEGGGRVAKRIRSRGRSRPAPGTLLFNGSSTRGSGKGGSQHQGPSKKEMSAGKDRCKKKSQQSPRIASTTTDRNAHSISLHTSEDSWLEEGGGN